jgi:hypothetical protein
VRGWGNAGSDLDIYVIAESAWRSSTAQVDTVALDPDSIPVEGIIVDGRRWDIEYWLESQVNQVVKKVSAESLTGNQPAGRRMTSAEITFLQWIGHAQPVDRDEWLGQLRERLAGSAISSVMVLRALHTMDIYAEDAVGQLNSGDVRSAVLSAKLTFRYAIEALLSVYGEYGESTKWFGRRFQAADPKELTFDEYWAVETMRSFDPAAPQRWVREVLELCQRISTEVEIG